MIILNNNLININNKNNNKNKEKTLGKSRVPLIQKDSAPVEDCVVKSSLNLYCQ